MWNTFFLLLLTFLLLNLNGVLTLRKDKIQRQKSPIIRHKILVQNGNSSSNVNFRDLKRHGRQNKIINIPNHWEKNPYLFQTYNEPDLHHLMPALSNGFLGTTAKNDSVYVNGLFNGAKEKSHRVRVPSMTAVNVYFSIYTDNDISTYHFDCRRGVYIIERKNNEAHITQRFYVHRRLKNIIVNEIRVELLTRSAIMIETDNVTMLDLSQTSTTVSPLTANQYSYYVQRNNPENILYEQRVQKAPTTIQRNELNDGIYYLQATIPDTELPNKRQKQIHTYYTNIPSKFVIYPNTTVKTFHFIQSIDSDNFRAKNAYEEALRMIQQDPNSLYVSHVTSWEEIWQKSGIAMISENTYTDSNQESFKLAQRLYASFYNLYSSLPSNIDTQFYGLSPSGLAYGGLKREYFNNSPITQSSFNRQISEGYGGHVMYTQELWILPLISMFNHDMSRTIINSRLRRGLNTDHMNVYEQAKIHADQEGFDGLRYPWEQGDYGVDVSATEDARKSKIHTSADISFGIRCFLRATHSKEFVLQSVTSEASVRGEDFINQIAEYWSDRFKLDSITNQYEIKGVSFGEKPQSREINNDIFTNYIGSLTMDTYKYALRVTDRNPYDARNAELIREYDQIINKVRLPYDNLKQLYLEYDNFNSQQNEEAWAPYLNYPLGKHLTYTQKKILYDSYAMQLQPEGKSLLAYSSFLVGYSELNEEKKAQDYLSRMSNHFSEPFMIMSEYPNSNSNLNHHNTFNYLPGYAAFASSFIAGFCGVRYRDFQLDLVYPSEQFRDYQTQALSPQFPVFKQPTLSTESWNITGLLYRGNKLDIIYNLRAKSVEIRNRRANDQSGPVDDMLEILVYEGTEKVVKPLRIGDVVTIGLSTELWNYAPKKNRLQKNHYSNNMHILASIYPVQYNKHLLKASNSSNRLNISFLFITFVMSIFYKLNI
ncbi:unnamed protein product [Brachionus calyciflorus]|uniref:Glycoside hydrolase family 65 central catalytic domain-containing protein n=1 Tax=Brachionus calyciflorus TaxID=104777 RepID=A0A813M606_9BILA|nr:unnamed protein product [Brachionus calyciflorus]